MASMIVAMSLSAMLAALPAQTTGGTPPQPIMPSRPWMTDDDYPAEALKNREQGTTEFIVTVGASGKVTACRVTRSSGSVALDGATCALMARQMRFKPARDASGTRIESEFASRLNWKLPR